LCIQELLRGFSSRLFGALLLVLTVTDGYLLDEWCSTIEYKDLDIPMFQRGSHGWDPHVPKLEEADWFYTIEEELAYSTQKPEDVRIVKGSAVLVAHRNLKLVEPDARIYRELLAAHCFEGDRTRYGMQQRP
jgi:hypothetical protein